MYTLIMRHESGIQDAYPWLRVVWPTYRAEYTRKVHIFDGCIPQCSFKHRHPTPPRLPAQRIVLIVLYQVVMYGTLRRYGMLTWREIVALNSWINVRYV